MKTAVSESGIHTDDAAENIISINEPKPIPMNYR